MVLHLIGHLQKNKAGKAVKIYDYIQTVDSLELAKKIQKKANEIKKTQKIYMQINIGNIKGRYGFKTREIYDATKTINELENISIEGVMIIPPLTSDEKKYINYFTEAKKIQKKLKKSIKSCKEISMGMTNDYEHAINEGATHIRIGSALFGERRK